MIDLVGFLRHERAGKSAEGEKVRWDSMSHQGNVFWVVGLNEVVVNCH